MHHRGIVLAGEDVSSSAHVGRELVYLFDSVHGRARHVLIAEIPDDEFIRRRLFVFVPLQIDGADPKTFGFQPFYKMAPDESTGAVDEHFLHPILYS
jgi:hypothetical protein